MVSSDRGRCYFPMYMPQKFSSEALSNRERALGVCNVGAEHLCPGIRGRRCGEIPWKCALHYWGKIPDPERWSWLASSLGAAISLNFQKAHVSNFAAWTFQRQYRKGLFISWMNLCTARIIHLGDVHKRSRGILTPAWSDRKYHKLSLTMSAMYSNSRTSIDNIP